MAIVPIFTSDQIIYKKISETLDNFKDEEIVLVPIGNVHDAIEYIAIVRPELVIVNFSDPVIDSFLLLATIMSNSWSLGVGVIGIYQNNEITQIENIKGTNLISSFCYDDISEFLPKILKIIYNNRFLLLELGLQKDFSKEISGKFTIENNPHEVKYYVDLICNFLVNTNRIELNQKFNLKIALTELLMNAIEHGNCGITYEEKSEWLKKSFDISELIAKKNTDENIKKRKVVFEYFFTPTKGIYYICDEGNGFDWKKVKSVTLEECLLELHGRGILIAEALVQNLTYNQKGNGVTFKMLFTTGHSKQMAKAFPNVGEVDTLNSQDIHLKSDKFQLT